jgi:hypothetical protein
MSSYTIFIYTTRRVPLLLSSLHPLGRGPPGVPSRDSNSGLPQQADALQSEPHRTLTERHRTAGCRLKGIG